MDGSSGTAPVTPKGWFVLFLATFQVAFAVSGKTAIQHRKKGLAHMGRGECDSAAGELLKAVSAGDSSNVVVLNLAQALECEGRHVDALSATYLERRADTLGRLDVLLYRAELLRRMGLADEAAKVEDEAGGSLGTSSGWIRGWSLSGSAGWIYDEIRKSPADTARNLSLLSEGINGNADEIAVVKDSMEVVGAQVPVSASLSLYLLDDRHYLALDLPFQLTAPTDLTTWLAASAGMQLMAASTWGPRFSSLFALGGTRTWYPVEGGSPTFQSSANGQASGTWVFAPASFSLASSFGATWDELNWFRGCTVNHSLGGGLDLPAGLKASAGAGFTWYFDDSRRTDQTYPKTVIVVQGAKPYIGNRHESLAFLDTAGNALPNNDLNRKKYAVGIVAGQWIERGTFDYPLSNPEGWRRWNAGLSLTQKPFKRLRWTVSIDLARTEWNHEGTWGYFSPDLIDEVYENNLLNGVKTLVFYRDAVTGEEYWIRKAASANLVPLVFRKRRLDWTGTVGVGLKFDIASWLSAGGGWTGVRNRSNLGEAIEGTSYTRNLWNASATVSW